jgi:hypothetical protein
VTCAVGNAKRTVAREAWAFAGLEKFPESAVMALTRERNIHSAVGVDRGLSSSHVATYAASTVKITISARLIKALKCSLRTWR